MPTHDGRVDAARDIAKLLQRRRDLPPCLIQTRPRFGIAVQALFEQAQLERQGNEPLLRAVVKVPLESPALVLTSIDDPRARALELFEASSQLGVQSAVLECDGGGRADGVEQLGFITKCRVVQ